MAKRKRLSPAAITGTDDPLPPDLETKAQNGWVGVRSRTTRAPIAEVSGEAAAQSAFEEVAGELRAARTEGRMVIRLPLETIEAGHLVRDRLTMDAEEMETLTDSLRARGQQTPIEVQDLGGGRYGLISGWRRLTALRTLHEETGEDRFSTVQALVRSPAGASAAYLAMVEENEIRSGLSFYERARISVQAVRLGVYRDTPAAVQALFASARAPKRSKILSFVTLVEELDDILQFPAAIPEKLGLALTSRLQKERDFGRRLTGALRKAAPATATDERAVLDGVLKASANLGRPKRKAVEEIAPGLSMDVSRRGVVLSGAELDPDLVEDLRNWLRNRLRSRHS